MDASKAYGIGRQAAQRNQGPIEAPAEIKGFEKHFWDGVRDLRAEDRINNED